MSPPAEQWQNIGARDDKATAYAFLLQRTAQLFRLQEADDLERRLRLLVADKAFLGL